MAVKKTATKKRITKGVDKGQVHIQASFNNTIITITDERGNTVTAVCAAAERVRLSQLRWLAKRPPRKRTTPVCAARRSS